jgi:hypothetical protein
MRNFLIVFHMDEVEAVAKGTSLEDIVAGLLRGWGYEVQTRIRPKDKLGIEHEIDVLGRRQEPIGTFTIAVECKNHVAPIGIEDIRNFNDKLSSLGYAKGVFVSAGGFTIPALEYAKGRGLEVWDSSTLKDKLVHDKLSSEEIPNALPLTRSLGAVLAPTHLLNHRLLQPSDTVLTYAPYYFLGYHCFTQDRVNFQLVNLESKGLVVIDALRGDVVDSFCETGTSPALPNFGHLAVCSNIASTTVPKTLAFEGIKFSRVDVSPPKLSESDARRIAQIELTKGISRQYTYETTHGYGSNRRTVSQQATVRPRVNDVGLLYARFVEIPLLFVTYSYRDKRYRRMIQAATGKILDDGFSRCSVRPEDGRAPERICEECGDLACEKHGKACLVCGKGLCDQHVFSKGLVQRKFYCTGHSPP